jgi:lipopolysaccharide export system protein LptC
MSSLGFSFASRFWQRLLGLWNYGSIYLPLIMMGVLALGTYWLVRNTPTFNSVPATKEVLHEADYFMERFTIKNFNESGMLKSEIYGAQARHFPDTDTLEIDQARIRSTDLLGRLTTSTSNQAISNGDGSEVQLIGDALIVREASVDAAGISSPRMQFQGEFLHVFANDERVRSHKPVVLTRGGDEFTGDTFAYDNLTGIVNLKGRVKGLLLPRVRSAK